MFFDFWVLLKYLLEGLAVAIAAFYIPRRSVDLKEIALIALTAAAVFSILDQFSPPISMGARQGAGFGIGLNQVGFGYPYHLYGGQEAESRLSCTCEVDADYLKGQLCEVHDSTDPMEEEEPGAGQTTAGSGTAQPVEGSGTAQPGAGSGTAQPGAGSGTAQPGAGSGTSQSGVRNGTRQTGESRAIAAAPVSISGVGPNGQAKGAAGNTTQRPPTPAEKNAMTDPDYPSNIPFLKNSNVVLTKLGPVTRAVVYGPDGQMITMVPEITGSTQVLPKKPDPTVEGFDGFSRAF